MSSDNERRNRLRGELRLATPARSESRSPAPVGGRHGSAPLPRAVGGSPNICNKTGDAIQRDGAAAPPLDGLQKLALLRASSRPLSSAWLEVARAIGLPAFLQMWQILSDCDKLDERRRIVVPLFSHYERSERVDYIVRMLGAGKSDREIIAAVKRDCGEVLTPTSLRRIKRGCKINEGVPS